MNLIRQQVLTTATAYNFCKTKLEMDSSFGVKEK